MKSAAEQMTDRDVSPIFKALELDDEDTQDVGGRDGTLLRKNRDFSGGKEVRT